MNLVKIALSYSLCHKKVITILHGAALRTIGRGAYLLRFGTIASDIEKLNLWYLEHSPSLRQRRMSTLTAHRQGS